MYSNSLLKRNSLYNILYRGLNVFYPLISSIYISRVLSPQDLGKIVYAQTISSYFVTAAALGIPNYGIKAIGNYQKDRTVRSKKFCEIFKINAISTIATCVAYALFLSLINKTADKLAMQIFAVQLIFNFINIDWLYQGMEEYHYIAIRSLSVKAVSMVLLLLFVKGEADCYLYALILCFATVGNNILNFLRAPKYVDVKKYKLNLHDHIKPILILFASTIATEIYTMLDSTMIGIFCSSEDVAYYSNATKLVRFIYTLLTAAVAVYLPRLSLLYKQDRTEEYIGLVNKGMRICLVLAAPASVGVAILSKPIISLLFGNQYLPATKCVCVLSVLVLVFSVAYIGGHCVLISSNGEKYILKATVIGAACNSIMNYVLISKMGFVGAAVSSVSSEIIVTIILVANGTKVVQYTIGKKFFASLFVALFVMTFVLLIIRSFIVNDLILLIVAIPVCAIVYFLLFYMCLKMWGGQ